MAWLLLVLLLGLGADFIANDRPLVIHEDDTTSFPVWENLWSGSFSPIADYSTSSADGWVVWPVIAYDGTAVDLNDARYAPPSLARPAGTRAPHYLGTDALGRDVAAGLVHGSRVAVLVGVGATLIALFIGVILGGPAGFFGDTGLRWPLRRWGALVGGVVIGGFYGSFYLAPYFRCSSVAGVVAIGAVTATTLSVLLHWLLPKGKYWGAPASLPIDTAVLQLVEIFTTIPGLVLLIAVTTLLLEPSVLAIALIIGLLGWPRVVRFLRAEVLRIRSLPYIEAAGGSGIVKWRVLFWHALPNALGPIFVLIGFMVGGAILLEAFLSFLGLGLPVNEPTWGGLLRRARERPDAWWLALFPGLMLTLTVLALQIAVEGWRGSGPQKRNVL